MPPYEAAIKSGAASIMSAFNDFNSVPCTSNKFLLTDLLRNRWGFKGIVISDYNSVEELINHRIAKDKKDAAKLAFNAGLNIEMVSQCYLRHHKELVKEGKVLEKDLNQAVRYILEKKYELGLFQDPYRFYDENRSKRIINSLKIRETSRKMAERSIVLLKNDNHILPFNNEVRSIALIGHLAKSQSDMAGAWAGNVNRSKIVTLYEALRNNNINIFYSEGYDKKTGKITQLQTSLQAAQKADAVIVCIGELAEQSGESKSKTNIEVI